jgi:5'-nucleotidase
MPFDLSNCLVVAISSRALFDLQHENEIFEKEGLKSYSDYQRENESVLLTPGTGFPIAKAFLSLNAIEPNTRLTEVIIVSRNNADAGIRIFNSITNFGLDVTRAAFTSGEPVAKYLQSFKVDLFLSASEEDVQNAIEAGFAAGLIYSSTINLDDTLNQIRIAFDGDAVLFSEESEEIFQKEGLEAFLEHEKTNANSPLNAGPFAKFLKTISFLQANVDKIDKTKNAPRIKTALVTARNSPAHERVVKTLRAWNVRIDEAFFLGGISKSEVLRAFKPHIFFDDHPRHCQGAKDIVPTARVLVPKRSFLSERKDDDKD